jgi:colanic acid/amylovoran biosynthesis glycosyltransferase
MDVRLLTRNHGSAQHQVPFEREVIYLPSESSPTMVKFGWTLLFFLKLCFHPPKLRTALRSLRYGQGLRQKLQLAARSFPLYYYQTDLMYFPFGGLAGKYLEYILETSARVIFSLRGSDIHYYPVVDHGYRQRLKQALLSADGIHCVCTEILERAQEVAGSDLPHGKVIHTALAEPIQHDLPEHRHPNAGNARLEIISVGRLEWLKGLEHGIVAAHALLQRGVDFRWRIIGDGEYKLALQWAIRDMGLQEQVFLCGAMKYQDVLQLLKTADVLLHPSIHEGVSNAVLEAMALGLPVVASDVGGMREAIPSDVVGILVPPRDWKSMADALERLADDPEMRWEVGCAASAFVRTQFTVEKQTAGFLEFLHHALNQETV